MQALQNFFNQLLVNIEIYYDTASTGISTLTLGKTLALIGASIGMCLLVSLVYIFANRTTGYSAKSMLTILLMGPIVSVIVIAVGSNLARAISIGGGLALIRFRHSVDNPKDLIFIYLSAAVGMACGTGGIGFAAIAIGIILAVILIATLTGFDRIGGGSMRLTIMIPESLDFAGVFEPVLKQHCKTYYLERVKSVEYGTLNELRYRICLKDKNAQKALLDDIRVRNGNLNISITQKASDD